MTEEVLTEQQAARILTMVKQTIALAAIAGFLVGVVVASTFWKYTGYLCP